MSPFKKTSLTLLSVLSLQFMFHIDCALADVEPSQHVLAGKIQSFDLEIPQSSESKKDVSSTKSESPALQAHSHDEAEEYGEFVLVLLVIAAGVALIVWFAQVMVDFLFKALEENIKYE